MRKVTSAIENVLKKIKQGARRTLILSVLFLVLFSGGLIAFATPPASPYAQNETLDPSCAPGDAYCYTEIPDASITDIGLVNISAQSFAGIKTFASTISGSSGSAYGHYIHPTVSQSGTAAYIGLLVNVTEGATGSGTHYLADFQVDGASKLNIDNAGNVTAARSFAAGGGTIFPNVVGNFSGNTDSYLQVNVQNLNDGTSASSDFVATADDGDDSTYYVDLGINSSGYNDLSLIYGGPHTAYLYTSDSDLVIGTAGATESLKFFTGGDANANERMRISSTGYVGVGDTSPASLFTVGSGDKFQVDTDGNIVKINNVTTSFPSSQGASSSYLKNNGSGTLSWATLTTSNINEGSNLYWTNSRFDTRLDTATSAASLATVGTISSGTWNGTALTDAYVSDSITASNYVPLTQKGAANGVATLNGSGKVPSSQLESLALTDVFVVASQVAMLALSSATIGDVAVRTDTNESYILTDTDYSVLGNWVELLASSSVLSVNGETGAVNLTTTEISEGTNLYFTTARVDTQVATQKAQPNGLATLDANGKVPTSQLAAMSANDTYVVASEIAMLALSATQGDLAVRSDESKTYILADTDPTDIDNWVELLNSAAVISVNGATGIVSLDTGDISENGSLYFTNARARSAISLAGGNPLIYDNGTGILDMQEADTSTDGYITAVDWNTFNDKADVADLLTGATSGTGTETWLGVGAGASSGSTDDTVFIGIDAGKGATGATDAVFLGKNAGLNASSAIQAIFIGQDAGGAATNSTRANFIGYGAGTSATDAPYANFMGYFGGYQATNATYSNFMGSSAGYQATNASYSNFMGYQAGSGATNAKNSIFIGNSAGLNDTVNNTSSGYSILLGSNTSTGGFKDSIAIGTAATNTAINQLVIGGNSYAISNGFFGNGVTNASPAGFSLNATGGSGTNIAGAALTLAGGKGTGNALGGALIFQTSDAGASGTTLQTLTEKMRITSTGLVGIGDTTPSYTLDISGQASTDVLDPVFTAGTQNDLVSGGTHTGTAGNIFYVSIDGTGTPDTFTWYDDNSECAGAATVAITGSAQTLCNGVTVTFGSTSGHAGDETWYFRATYTTGGSINIADGGMFRINGAQALAVNDTRETISIGADTTNVESGSSNIAIGGSAGKFNDAVGSRRSVFLGVNAGYDALVGGTFTGITTGTDITLIGANTGTYNGTTSLTALSNATAIGAYAQVTQDNSLILGQSASITGTETKVGIGTPEPDASSILDIVSTTSGILIPRMHGTSRDAIASPATGLLIYNTNTNLFNFHNGSTWIAIASAGSSDVTVDSAYYNMYTGTISAGAALNGAGGGVDNILLGRNAGDSITTGAANIFLGKSAGSTITTASYNIAIGYRSGEVISSGTENTFIGTTSGAGNSTGGNNTFIGYEAGLSNTTSSNNTFIGSLGGRTNTTGTGDTFIGKSAGRLNTEGNNNTFIGYLAGDANTTAVDNTFVGMNAGLVSTGGTNSFFGKGAGVANTTATGNTFLGYSAGATITTGGNNTIIGDRADVSSNSITKSIALGSAAVATASNQFVVSSGSTTAMDAYFGNGVTAASPNGLTLNVTGGSGTNQYGAGIALAGGKATGNAVGGAIGFYTSDAGASGTTLQTLTEKWRVTAEGHLNGANRDLGDGAAGNYITLGRNTNATNTGAGSINFQKKSGTAGYVWQDNSGNMRIHTAAPTNALDTAGTVIGTQTSTRDTKQEIEDYTDYTNALQLILDAPLHTFRYRNEVEGYGTDSPLAKVRIGYIADEVDPAFMWGNVIDQVSVNGILIAAVKELDIKITNIADLANENNSLVTALRNWLASATNGLVNIFSDKITTKELCVEDVCINKDQLRALIENAGNPPAGGPPAEEETPPTEEVPPSETPPSDTPPSDAPPSDTPPTEENPPIEQTPPSETPPQEEPPEEQSPPEPPPSDTPSI